MLWGWRGAATGAETGAGARALSGGKIGKLAEQLVEDAVESLN